jgi:hypothetical protein
MKKLLLLFTVCSLALQGLSQNVGIGTTTPRARLHVKDSAVLFTGPATLDDTTHTNPPVSGAGSRMMWYPQKLAFRVGIVTDAQWDEANTGTLSFATGINTIASGLGSTAMGVGAIASGTGSNAWGTNAHASGVYSMALGFGCTAIGPYSLAIGYNSTAADYYSIAMGSGTLASGAYSTSMGNNTHATGNTSTAMGGNTYANGEYSTAMGQHTIARGSHAVVMGRFNDTATSTSLFEIGYGTSHSFRRNALTVMGNGCVGIGKANPTRKLEVFLGSTGTPYHFQTSVGVEYDGTHFINLLTNSLGETGVLFGNADYGSADGGVIFRAVSTPTDARTMYFRVGGDTRMKVHPNGNAWLQGSLAQASDACLKKDIVHLANVMTPLQQLNGYTYYWKDEDNDKEQQVGVLAQEVQKVFPQLVRQTAEGNLSVNYTGLIPVLIEALKEQQKQIDELKQRLRQ